MTWDQTESEMHFLVRHPRQLSYPITRSCRDLHSRWLLRGKQLMLQILEHNWPMRVYNLRLSYIKTYFPFFKIS